MSRVVRIVCVAVAMSGCAAWRGSAPGIPADRPPVAVRLSGPALVEPSARAAAVAGIGTVTQRRVDIVDDAANEAVLRELAARVRRERATVRTYDWHEPRCAKHVDALVAARLGADAVYRLSLGPGTAPPARGMLDVFAATPTPVTGEVSVRAMDGAGARAQTATIDGPDLSAAVAAGVARLPGLPAPRWDAVANGLVKAGCPFLALAVQDLQLRDAKAGRAIRERALAAMARAVGRRTAATRAPEPSPAAVAEEPAVAVPSSPDTRYSCEALCGLHMVELCNKDRTLWNQNLVAWQRTGCGTRRPEPFLMECYRRQRISGTFQDACVRPCEASPDGRNALLDVLQGAGCLRGPS